MLLPSMSLTAPTKLKSWQRGSGKKRRDTERAGLIVHQTSSWHRRFCSRTCIGTGGSSAASSSHLLAFVGDRRGDRICGIGMLLQRSSARQLHSRERLKSAPFFRIHPPLPSAVFRVIHESVMKDAVFILKDEWKLVAVALGVAN